MSNSTLLLTEPMQPDFKKQEIAKFVTTVGTRMGTAVPEMNFSVLSMYTIFIPILLTVIKSKYLLSQDNIGDIWNDADGISQIILGGSQAVIAATGNTHQRIFTGLKGGINISSGTQLVVLTALSGSLGAIGFAVAFGIAATLSLADTVESARQYIDDDYWLKEKVDLLELLTTNDQDLQAKKIILDNVAAAKRQHPELATETTNCIEQFFHHFCRTQIKKSAKKVRKIQDDIFAKIITDYTDKGGSAYLMKISDDNYNKLIKNLRTEQQLCLQKIKEDHRDHYIYNANDYGTTGGVRKATKQDFKHNAVRNLDNEYHNENSMPYPRLPSYNNCSERTKEIKDKLLEETTGKGIDTFFLFLAFAGMACLCIPGAQLLAPFLIAPATGYFLGKYGYKGVSAIASSFFKNPKEQEIAQHPEETYRFNQRPSHD